MSLDDLQDAPPAVADVRADPPVEAPVTRRRSWVGPVVTAAVVAALGVGIYAGIHSRGEAERALAQATVKASVPTVEVIHPKADAPDAKLMLPGTMEAMNDTAIYARTNGYLKRWYFDIGAHVKRGDLLAEIETPEVDQQLLQARADLVSAQANLDLAAITAQRQTKLSTSGDAPIQTRDNAVTALNAAKAMVQARQAAVAQLEEMQSFERVEAPFDGTITARTIDVGSLIAAGSATSARELFHLVASDWLRIYVSVPEIHAPAIKVGEKAAVTLDEFPNQTFEGIVVRTSNAIDQTSHTLLVEVDVSNKDGKLLPGSYAHVLFTLPTAGESSVVVPANALLFRKEGEQVGVVRDGKVDLVSIKIGQDFGDSVEVVSGLKPSDQIVINPADSLVSGTPVVVSAKADTAPAK